MAAKRKRPKALRVKVHKKDRMARDARRREDRRRASEYDRQAKDDEGA